MEGAYFKSFKALMRRKDLSLTAKSLYCYIVDRTGNNDASWPSLRLMADDLGTSKTCVIRGVNELIRANLVMVIRGGPRRSNRYTYGPYADHKSPEVMVQYGPQRSTFGPYERSDTDLSGPRVDQNETHIRDPEEKPNKRPSIKPKPDKAILEPDLAFTCLATERFRGAWAEWVVHRREIKHALTPTTVKRQIAKLAKMGHDPAIASIERSIENGWQGLFDVEEPRGGRGRSRMTDAERREAIEKGRRENLERRRQGWA